MSWEQNWSVDNGLADDRNQVIPRPFCCKDGGKKYAQVHQSLKPTLDGSSGFLGTRSVDVSAPRRTDDAYLDFGLQDAIQKNIEFFL